MVVSLNQRNMRDNEIRVYFKNGSTRWRVRADSYSNISASVQYYYYYYY